ncbi:serine kinase [Puteibacter caeruleilacunae]|nr:serine kinase [Puteibacter caeruleilacunae]
MKVSNIIKELNLSVYGGDNGLDNEVDGGYVSDLLSDVMGNAEESQIWITLQTHRNVMAIASLKDLAAVILVNDLKPDEDMLEQANEEGIPVLGTGMTTFDVGGKLYNLLKG